MKNLLKPVKGNKSCSIFNRLCIYALSTRKVKQYLPENLYFQRKHRKRAKRAPTRTHNYSDFWEVCRKQKLFSRPR